MSDLIDRHALMKEFSDFVRASNNSDFARTPTWNDAVSLVGSMPSAQPDIKQAAKLLSDFIESCPGGDSYLITPDGEKLRTDWGYATEGIKLIHDWAERRTDEQ